jgi:hypothetical protein
MKYKIFILLAVLTINLYAQKREGRKPKFSFAFTLGITSLSNTKLRNTDNYFDLVDDITGGLLANFIFNYYFNDKWGAEFNYLTSSYVASNNFDELALKYYDYNISDPIYGLNISNANLGIIRRFHLSKFAFEPEFVIGYSYVRAFFPDLKLKKIGYNQIILLDNQNVKKRPSLNLGLAFTTKFNIKRRFGFFFRFGMLWNKVKIDYTTETVYSNYNRTYNDYEINNLVGNFSFSFGVFWNIIRKKFEKKPKKVESGDFIDE